MKLPDVEKLFFRLHLLILAVVFVLMTPAPEGSALHFYLSDSRSWWKISLALLGASMVVWLFFSLMLPRLFKIGFFEERRTHARPLAPWQVRAWKVSKVIVLAALQILMIIFCAWLLTNLMESTRLEGLFDNLHQHVE